MMRVIQGISILELATLVSQTLERAGIGATLSGGGAVCIYTDNRYQSKDLDFITTAPKKDLEAALRPLGFTLAKDGRHFTHPKTDLFVEFPSGPLEFGDQAIPPEAIPPLSTPHGSLKVITPTQCVMDRLSAYWHWKDRQAWDQAVMVVQASAANVDHRALVKYARQEGESEQDIEQLWSEAAK